MIKKNKLEFYAALSILSIIILASLLAPLLAPYNPFQPNMAQRLQPPSCTHWFGTDALGRDMFSRILYGGRTSILLALAAAFISLSLGLLFGTLAGFFTGIIDLVITNLSNIFQGIPGSCFMIAIVGICGANLESLLIALIITSWSGFSRIVRSEVLRIREEPFIEGLRCIGCSNYRLIIRHIFPNIFYNLLILFTIRIGRAVLSIAGMSFLGLGVQPPTPDWSVMISDSVLYYRSSPHLIIVPGFCIFLLIYSLNILGDILRENLDIRHNEVCKW